MTPDERWREWATGAEYCTVHGQRLDAAGRCIDRPGDGPPVWHRPDILDIGTEPEETSNQ